MAKIYLYREYYPFCSSVVRSSIEQPTNTWCSVVEIIGEQEIILPNGYKISNNGKHIIEKKTGVVVPSAFSNIEERGKICTCFDFGDFRYCVASWKKNGTPIIIK